jgi:hypothetical protein
MCDNLCFGEFLSSFEPPQMKAVSPRGNLIYKNVYSPFRRYSETGGMFLNNNRGEWIRTTGLLVPNQAL